MADIRNDWTLEQINNLYELPFVELLYQAQNIHRQYFDPNCVQLSTLINVKSGACPEDCAYCPQSAHYKTATPKHKLMPLDDVIAAAKIAKENGASRFCMGAAWRSPPKQDFVRMLEMIKEVRKLGLETCVTLGLLNEEQVTELEAAGLDYYNHNLDSSAEFYRTIITTRSYEDRLLTLQRVGNSKIKVCCGGIVGMGETRMDRMKFLQQLANLTKHPESVPINRLIPIQGTPLDEVTEINNFEFVRTIAVARIMMPNSYVRLSAGRETMSDEMQALCFFAGANSIHYGEKLLVTANPAISKDQALFDNLGIKAVNA